MISKRYLKLKRNKLSFAITAIQEISLRCLNLYTLFPISKCFQLKINKKSMILNAINANKRNPKR